MRLVIALALSFTLHVHAALEVPLIFTDHLVLQREIKAPVWGKATPGAEVKVQLADEPALTTRADAEGRWMVEFIGLKTRAQGTTLVISSGSDQITISDVLVGEVWYGGGQSNMAVPLEETTNGKEEAAAHSDPLLRFHIVGVTAAPTPQFDVTGKTFAFKERSQWYTATNGQALRCSGTGYYFAKELRGHLGNVPVAILQCAVGGRPIQAHCSPEVLSRTDLGRRQLAQLQQAIKDWDSGKTQADYPAKLAAWQASGKSAKFKPEKPQDPRTDVWQPASIYHGMVHPQIPFGFRGVMWIQGENNAKAEEEPQFYADTLVNMLTDWRTRFGHEFTCLIVQLAGFRSPTEVPQVPNMALTQHAWPFVCNQQRLAHERLPRSGLVVVHDLGEVDNIHPRNKLDVARRLGRWAKFYDYNGKAVPSGPLFEKAEFSGAEVSLSFKFAEGLKTNDGKPPAHFDLCGADGKLHWADARIEGSKIILSSPAVPQPVQVRYAWSCNPLAANLVNVANLPASAFIATKDDPTGKGSVLTDRP